MAGKLTCSACCLLSSLSDLISFYFSPSPLAAALVASLLLLDSTSASGPWHLLSSVLSAKNSFTPGTHVTAFRCWLRCPLVVLPMGSSLTMLSRYGCSPHHPLPYLLLFIPWHYLVICLWFVSSARMHPHEDRDFISFVLCCIPCTATA